MLNGASPIRKMRVELLGKCSEMGLSSHSVAELTVCMDGQTEEEKEKLAEQLLAIILESKSEMEMIKKATQLR